MSILNHTNLNIRSIIKQISPAQPCVLCEQMSHDGLCCAACETDLPYYTEPRCPICALPNPLGEVCGQCLKQAPLFHNTIVPFRYQFPLDKLIHAMKYGEQLALLPYFASKFSIPESRPDYLISMPIHPTKLRQRGFNQSQLLAQYLANRFHIPLLNHACERTRDTPAQSTLPWNERIKNVRDAFACHQDLRDKHVALVDDVLTTGATLNALASAVEKKGAIKISAWVIARTIPR